MVPPLLIRDAESYEFDPVPVGDTGSKVPDSELSASLWDI